MNTFAYMGDLKNSPEVACVYHSEEAENQYLDTLRKAGSNNNSGGSSSGPGVGALMSSMAAQQGGAGGNGGAAAQP
jgi:hypothetical protein